MTRREFVSTAAAAFAAPSVTPAPLIVPVHQVTDSRANFTPEELSHFSSNIWPEAVRDFSRCGIELPSSKNAGEIGRSPGGQPVFKGLERGVINLVLTDHIPMAWDNGRGLTGLSTRHHGYHMCIVALSYAHSHQVPFLSVNTCVHELLHVLLQDIFAARPKGWWPHAQREFEVDWYATRPWLFDEGAAIREAAEDYLKRLHAGKSI